MDRRQFCPTWVLSARGWASMTPFSQLAFRPRSRLEVLIGSVGSLATTKWLRRQHRLQEKRKHPIRAASALLRANIQPINFGSAMGDSNDRHRMESYPPEAPRKAQVIATKSRIGIATAIFFSFSTRLGRVRPLGALFRPCFGQLRPNVYDVGLDIFLISAMSLLEFG